MGFNEGRIILDSDNGAYYPGQTVYGRVVFDQEKVKTIHGIYVDIKGFCKVHWTTSESRREGNHTRHYTVDHDSHEEYFRRKTFIFGTESGEHHLQPGHHDFRFDCHIPANSPSSFEGEYGHIRYRIKVIMVTSGIFSSNKEKMVAIRVIAPLDLNQNPYCKEPIEFELISSYCCWCVSAGSSEVQVRLPVGGYCPGQVMPLEVTCKNPSSVEIDTIKFAIKKDVKFTATSESGTRNVHTTVAEIKKGPIPAGTTRNWTVEMDVPTMDIYNVNACRYIDIDYTFKVSTEVDGCHEGTEEVHPIIFGNVPLVGVQDNIQNPLQDQMPRPMEVQNVHGANVYPPAPIINQPLPNHFPAVSPYPGSTGYPTSPANPPYPNVSPNPPPYPGISPPYPGGNSPYPGGNPPYPGGNPPYPGGNLPYPGGNPPYPGGNPPYPSNTPYSNNPAQPGGLPSFAATGSPALKTGTLGFVAPSNGGLPPSMPMLPMGANVPYPTSPASNPYATASAPVPSTPATDEKKSPLDAANSASIPPYNPDFVNEKKDEKD